VSAPPRPGVAAGIAVPWGGAAAVIVYAALRAAQVAFTREANPATIVWTAHSGYVWRALIAGYAGGMAAIVAYVVARRDAERAARALPPVIVAAAGAIAAQAWLAP